jgi:hypothetical protein
MTKKDLRTIIQEELRRTKKKVLQEGLNDNAIHSVSIINQGHLNGGTSWRDDESRSMQAAIDRSNAKKRKTLFEEMSEDKVLKSIRKIIKEEISLFKFKQRRGK